MISPEDIKDQLRSEKVSLRKKARTECEKIFNDRSIISNNAMLTMGFLPCS